VQRGIGSCVTPYVIDTDASTPTYVRSTAALITAPVIPNKQHDTAAAYRQRGGTTASLAVHFRQVGHSGTWGIATFYTTGFDLLYNKV
jgi:hypothetical protein